MKFTQQLIDRLKAGKSETRITDDQMKGLSVRAYPSGKKSYFYRYLDPDGIQKSIKIGDAKTISLKKARSTAFGYSQDLEIGVGIGDAGKRFSFKEMAQRYRGSNKFKELSVNTQAYYSSVIDTHILPRFGDRNMDDIRVGEWVSCMDDVYDGVTGGGAARSIKSVASVIYDWGLQREFVTKNVMLNVKHVAPVKMKKRVLSETEIAHLWWEMSSGKHSREIEACAKVVLLTAQRIGETTSMRVSDLDFESRVWTIPDGVTKTRTANTIPLSDLVISILREVIGDRTEGLVFPINRQSVSNALRRKEDDPRFDGRFTAHDLRRTFVTNINIARKGVSESIVRRIINHRSLSSGAFAHYNHYDYLDEKREVLEIWSTYVHTLVRDIDGSPSQSISPREEL